MVREVIEFCLTPASFQSRISGSLYEAIAFEFRGRRNEENWQPHWATCRNLVRKFWNQHPQAKSLTIFGSGCLFEIPKQEMLQRFKKIILVDQVFPRSVRNWARQQQTEIELCECDLTKRSPNEFESDLSLSSNLLSQLALAAPTRKKELEHQHLEQLRSMGTPVLLWSDFERVFLKADGQEVLFREPTVLSTIQNPIHQWDWSLAPAPEISPEFDVILKMKAVVL